MHGGKGTFQNYNADQKTAIKALPETADPNDYYLFFTDCYNRLDTAGNTSKEAVNGYMPVGRHYGFIYNEYTNARTIAHELGHGTNSLHHTFSAESETFRTTEKTDNLMDYNGGDYLNHRQWQWSHEKHRNVLGFLDDEEESEANILPFIYWLGHNKLGGKYISDELEGKIDDHLDMFKAGYAKHSDWMNGRDKTINNDYAEWSVESNDIVPQVWLSIKASESTDVELHANRVYSCGEIIVTATKERFVLYSKEEARFRRVNLYSFVENAKLSNYKIKELSDLENNKRVKAGYYDFGDKFIVIAFFSEDGSLDLVLQVIANENDSDMASLAEDWVRSLLMTPCDIQEFVEDKMVVTKAVEKAVESTLSLIDNNTQIAACNLCTRAAFYYATGDSILFPKEGAQINISDGTIKNVFTLRGRISGSGLAKNIIEDFESGLLDDSFEILEKNGQESEEEYWKRVQNMVDNGAKIIGTYKKNHVFMVVPGGLCRVIDNSAHTEGGKLLEYYNTNPSFESGDKYGFSFASRNVSYVLRILECGVGVKQSNVAIYANMDYKNLIKNVKLYKYKK